MTLVFEHLGGRSDGLGRCDPRWKLASLAIAAAAVASLRSVPAAGAAVALALVLARAGGLPGRWLLSRLAVVAVLLAPFALLPLLPAAGPSWGWGFLRVWPAGLELALLLAAKALALTTLVLALAATSPLPDTLKAAQSLRVPGLLIHLALLAYRYVFLLAAEFGRLRTALRVRGFRARASAHTYRTVGHVTGILLLRAAERAERVGQAMRCRGFDGRWRSLHQWRTTATDIALLAGVGAAAGALTAVDWAMR
jgi:cobalt/nickel transport system permease protein